MEIAVDDRPKKLKRFLIGGVLFPVSLYVVMVIFGLMFCFFNDSTVCNALGYQIDSGQRSFIFVLAAEFLVGGFVALKSYMALFWLIFISGSIAFGVIFLNFFGVFGLIFA